MIKDSLARTTFAVLDITSAVYIVMGIFASSLVDVCLNAHKLLHHSATLELQCTIVSSAVTYFTK